MVALLQMRATKHRQGMLRQLNDWFAFRAPDRGNTCPNPRTMRRSSSGTAPVHQLWKSLWVCADLVRSRRGRRNPSRALAIFNRSKLSGTLRCSQIYVGRHRLMKCLVMVLRNQSVRIVHCISQETRSRRSNASNDVSCIDQPDTS